MTLLLLLAACRWLEPLDLGPRLPLPEVPPLRQGPTLVVVVANLLSPEEAEPYRLLAQDLARASGLKGVVVQRRSYQEALEMLRKGEADVGFLCTLAAGMGIKEGFLEPLAASWPRFGEYRSVILVPATSRARTLGDLEGQRFALVDPLSNTGAAWPRAALAELGRTPEEFFRQVIYTYAHDRSIRAVSEGFVDGAAVDSLVYEALIRKEPGLQKRLRVVWKSPPDPPPPVVAQRGLDPKLKAALARRLLRTEREGPEEALARLNLRGFAPAREADYLKVYERWAR